MTEALVITGYESHSEDAFRINLKGLNKVLLNNQKNIELGPRFHITTETESKDLHIQSIFLQNIKNTQTNFDDDKKSLVLIATDLDNQLVGYRTTHFLQGDIDSFSCFGEINVLKSGKGYATQIELCHLHLLQKEANDLNIVIQYEVEDGNQRILNNFENLYSLGKLNIEELVKKRNERKRWEALYGPDGLLGFDIKGKKDFFPNRQVFTKYDCKTTSDVFLKREDCFQLGIKRIVGLFKECYGQCDEKELKEKRSNFLNNSLLPQIETVLNKR